MYFLYTNFFAENDRFADFAIRVNEAQVCYAKADMDNADANDNGTPSCGVATLLSEGIQASKFEYTFLSNSMEGEPPPKKFYSLHLMWSISSEVSPR